MDPKPIISIVIPTYNRADTVVAAVESVLAQSYPRLEVIIVDDGSVDGTAEAIQSLIRRADSGSDETPEIRYLYQANMGQSHARNTGIAAAHGEWIGFLDSDDCWLPDKIEWQVRAINQFKSTCGACVSDTRLVNKSGGLDICAFRLAKKRYEEPMGTLPDATVDIANLSDGFWIQALIVRNDLAKQIGGFDVDIHFMEDHDFLFRLSLVTSFCYVNLPLVVLDRTNIATDPNARVRAWDSAEFRLKAQQQMYEKWLTMGRDLPSEVRTAIVRRLRAVHSAWANVYLRHDQFDLARKAVSTAINYKLTPSLALKWVATRVAPRLAKNFAPEHRHQN